MMSLLVQLVCLNPCMSTLPLSTPLRLQENKLTSPQRVQTGLASDPAESSAPMPAAEVWGAKRVTCELYITYCGSLENCHGQFSRDRFCPAWAFQSLRRPSLGLLSELEVWGGGGRGGNMWIICTLHSTYRLPSPWVLLLLVLSYSGIKKKQE